MSMISFVGFLFSDGLMLIHVLRVKCLTTMSAIKISSILHIFLEDGHLLRHWIRFANSLDIPPSKIYALKRKLRLDYISEYEVVGSLLSNWISRNGEAATVESLCATLQYLQFIYVKGRLSNITFYISNSVCFK